MTEQRAAPTDAIAGWVSPPPAAGAQPGMARSARGISNWLVGALGIGILADGAAVAHSVDGLSLLDRYVNGIVTDADLEAWDSTFGLLGLLQGGVLIGTAIIWLAWQHRLVASIAPLGLGAPVATPGKSVAWWFVPVANIVMVYRIYRDLAAKFAPASVDLVRTWWAIYLASGLIGQIAGRFWAQEFETLEQFNLALTLWMLADFVTVVSALVAILLVRRLQAGQSLAIASRFGSSEPAGTLASPVEPILVAPSD